MISENVSKGFFLINTLLDFTNDLINNSLQMIEQNMQIHRKQLKELRKRPTAYPSR